MRSPVRPGQLGFAAQYRWEIPRGAGLQARCCARLCLGLVLLCGAKRAGSYRGWGARGIGPQKPGRRRATTPPPMTVATKRAAAMQGPLKQMRSGDS